MLYRSRRSEEPVSHARQDAEACAQEWMTTPAASTAESVRTLRIRQAVVIALLFGGYASLYFCRADLSVATPLLAKELVGRGTSYDDALVRIGGITSLGILAY